MTPGSATRGTLSSVADLPARQGGWSAALQAARVDVLPPLTGVGVLAALLLLRRRRRTALPRPT
jgi:hypothetical protein